MIFDLIGIALYGLSCAGVGLLGGYLTNMIRAPIYTLNRFEEMGIRFALVSYASHEAT